MNHGTQKLHELGHLMTELIKYVATTICSRNKQHALKRSCLGMAILAISEIKLLNVLKTGKILRTIIHLNKKILPQCFE